jgi:hypothetical protein
MITRHQIESILGFNPISHQNVSEDYVTNVISLLRERIPHEVCNRIITGAEQDSVYLCSVEDVLPYLSSEDLDTLYDSFVWIERDTLVIAAI